MLAVGPRLRYNLGVNRNLFCIFSDSVSIQLLYEINGKGGKNAQEVDRLQKYFTLFMLGTVLFWVCYTFDEPQH